MRFFKHGILMCLVAIVINNNAAAEIPLSISTGPGGLFHRYAIGIQPLLSKWLGEHVVLEFKPGANGAIAALSLASNKNVAFLISGIQSDLSVNQITEIIPVVHLGASPQVLYVKSDLGVTNIAELVKSKKKLNYGLVNGSANGYHMRNYAQALSSQVDFQEVLYKGANDVLKDVIGGHLDVGVGATTTILSAAQTGRITILAAFGPHRSLLFPTVSTFLEQGYKWANDPYRGHTVLWASPATDRATIELVRKNFKEWAKTAEAWELLKSVDHRLQSNSDSDPEQIILTILRK